MGAINIRLNDIIIDNAEYDDRNGITPSASSLYTPVKEIIFQIGDIPFEVKTKYITNRIICLEPIKKIEMNISGLRYGEDLITFDDLLRENRLK